MGKQLNTAIRLNARQKEQLANFNSGRYVEHLHYGASRTGKSFLILYWLMTECLRREADCLVVRNTYESLQRGMIKQTMPAVLNAVAKANGYRRYQEIVIEGRPFARYASKEATLTFFNGHYIYFGSMKESKANAGASYDKILGTEWGHIFFDEVSEVDERPVDTLRSRLALKLAGDFPNQIIFALNPVTKLHWTYKRFFKHLSTTGEPLSNLIIDGFNICKWSSGVNSEFISSNYETSLSSMSALQRLRFLEGEYADEAEGEIFKMLTWVDAAPPAEEIEDCVIYTDPSAKDSKKNDYKASVLLGRKGTTIFLIDVRAVQGTSRQMLENIWELYQEAPVVPSIYMEKKQLPLDFDDTFELFQKEKRWVCPLNWDTRNMGDKFTFIESTLEPLVSTKRFVFCKTIEEGGCKELTTDQFVRFSRAGSTHDDIPDACAKGVSLLTRDIIWDSKKIDVYFGNRKEGLSTTFGERQNSLLDRVIWQ